MKKIRILAASLAVCIAVTTLAACNADSAKETKETKATEAAEETSAEESTILQLPGVLPNSTVE